jgi:hypothetical protein
MGQAVAHGMLFFSKSINDLDRIGVSSNASTNVSRADYVRDSTNYKYWISDGSDDTTTETLDQLFEEQTFDRIHLIGHNLKEFTIQYWDGASFVDFSTPIAETTNDQSTNYYEFDSVLTSIVRITMETTQIPDEEKRITQFLLSTQLHKLEGYPVFNPSFDRKTLTKETIRGRRKTAHLDESFRASISFNRYPVASDILFFKTLWDNMTEFLIWPCSADETIFRFNTKGTRLSDIYLCEIDGDFNQWFEANTYELGITGSINIIQVN